MAPGSPTRPPARINAGADRDRRRPTSGVSPRAEVVDGDARYRGGVANRISKPTAVSVAAAVTLLAIILTVGVPDPTPPAITWVAVAVALTSIGWALWRVRRDRRRYEDRLQADAATAAVLQERLATSRDLHDIVSHGLGAITTRAAVAARLNADDPDALRQALRDIEDASRSATAELRRTVLTLRGDAAPLEPTATLADADRLVARARDAGLAVEASGLETPIRSPLAAATISLAIRDP